MGDVGSLGIISYIAPSRVALALNIAYRAAKEAETLKRTFRLKPAPSPSGTVKSIENTGVLFDYIEHAMTSVFFAYQAIEAFCNDQLFKAPTNQVEVRRRRDVEKFERREAERKLKTSEKLGDALPRILGVSSPKNTQQWKAFRDLEAVRNEVVHMKNQTVRSADPARDSSQILFRLIAEDCHLWVRIAVASIEYFIRDPKPTWFVQIKKHEV